MQTEPMPVRAQVAEPVAPLAQYRLRSAVEVQALLRQFVADEAPLTLSTSDGLHYTTSLWAEDAERGVLVFSVDPADERVQRLLAVDEAVVVGYLDNVKVQFDVQGLMLVHGRDASALQAQFPQEIYRFQRRESFRVRPVGPGQPRVRLGAPRSEVPPLTLRVLDLSHGGVALLLQEPVPALQVGRLIEGAVLELDMATRLMVQLRVVHAVALTAQDGTPQGWRLGCDLRPTDGDGLRVLQRYLELAQKKRRLIAR